MGIGIFLVCLLLFISFHVLSAAFISSLHIRLGLIRLCLLYDLDFRYMTFLLFSQVPWQLLKHTPFFKILLLAHV